jgi:2'-hydroxyisoflavone reductase
MRVLVIGGSSFVGRGIVSHLIELGHEVTLFNRGQTDPGAFPRAEHIAGDRNHDLDRLAGRSWDATVDCIGYVPRQVRSLLESLGERAGHYTFISTISVYGDVAPGFDEAAPLLDPAWDDELVMDKYGSLKVACEQVARELAGDRLLTIRPGFVIGPHDPTHRFTYWVERVASRRSPMAGPDADQPLQTVDARDLGRFVAMHIDRRTVDTFHVAAPDIAPTFAAVLAAIADALGQPLPEVRYVGARAELPLSSEPSFWAKMRADISKAQTAGLTWRPLAETVRDTHDWVGKARADGYEPRPGAGPSEDEERALLG